MAKQSQSQKTGSIGHKWAMLLIERHPHWLSRDLSEDFGIDAEAELTEHGVNGEILKLQFKSSQRIEKSNGMVRFQIDRKYIDYARSCRYPVVLIQIDTTAEEAWFLWIQNWLLEQRRVGSTIPSEQQTFVTWVSCSQTLTHGLSETLKNVAKWRGETQLVLSLLDAMRAAMATQSKAIADSLVDLISAAAPEIADASLDVVIEEAVALGEQLRGTAEGLQVSDALFDLVRRFGDKVTGDSVDRMVCRDDSYSRTGIIALGILYDEFFDHTRSLGLTELFLTKDLRQVSFYCALREAFPDKKYFDFMFGPGDFCFAGLRFDEPTHTSFSNAYANRGPSAILDYLIQTDASH